MTKFSLAQLCGLTDTHINTQYALHRDVVPAFIELQKGALHTGFELCIASGFRDFYRQRHIWNAKFSGNRPVLDSQSRPVELSQLSDIEIIHAIMRWSALPGASRHHWGTDCDIYAKNLLPTNTQLQLEPWEYEQGGHQYPLAQWLGEHMADFDFYQPYQRDLGGVAIEPWHISYRPLAKQAEQMLSLPRLDEALSNIDKLLPPHSSSQETHIHGLASILHNLESLYQRYIINTDKD